MRERERERKCATSSLLRVPPFFFHPFFLPFFLSFFFLSLSPVDVFPEHNKQTPPRNLFSYVRGICQSTPLSPPSGSFSPLSFFLFSDSFTFSPSTVAREHRPEKPAANITRPAETRERIFLVGTSRNDP